MPRGGEIVAHFPRALPQTTQNSWGVGQAGQCLPKSGNSRFVGVPPAQEPTAWRICCWSVNNGRGNSRFPASLPASLKVCFQAGCPSAVLGLCPAEAVLT